MELKECTLHCDEMDKDFDVIVYGEAGRPTVVFPEGDASCTSWENGGMVEALSEFVEDGRIQLFCFDSVDSEGWYAHGARNSYRLGSLMPYLDYVRSGLLPFVSAHAASQDLPLVAGVGIGALNAALVMLRHPELFGGLLALSGTYDVRAFTDDVTEEWLSLSPVDLVRSLSPRGKCAGLLRKRPMAFVCGRHESESGIETQRALDALFAEKNLGATFEYWGYDVSHDWSWWQEEARQLLPCLLEGSGLAERSQIARISSAQADVKHAEDLLAQQRDELSAARDALSVAVEAVAAGPVLAMRRVRGARRRTEKRIKVKRTRILIPLIPGPRGPMPRRLLTRPRRRPPVVDVVAARAPAPVPTPVGIPVTRSPHSKDRPAWRPSVSVVARDARPDAVAPSSPRRSSWPAVRAWTAR